MKVETRITEDSGRGMEIDVRTNTERVASIIIVPRQTVATEPDGELMGTRPAMVKVALTGHGMPRVITEARAYVALAEQVTDAAYELTGVLEDEGYENTLARVRGLRNRDRLTLPVLASLGMLIRQHLI